MYIIIIIHMLQGKSPCKSPDVVTIFENLDVGRYTLFRFKSRKIFFENACVLLVTGVTTLKQALGCKGRVE